LRKKSRPKKSHKLKTKSASTTDVISDADVSSDNIVRLKLTTRKGTRIESVPLKKLKKLANNPQLYWKLEAGWRKSSSSFSWFVFLLSAF